MGDSTFVSASLYKFFTVRRSALVGSYSFGKVREYRSPKFNPLLIGIGFHSYSNSGKTDFRLGFGFAFASSKPSYQLELENDSVDQNLLDLQSSHNGYEMATMYNLAGLNYKNDLILFDKQTGLKYGLDLSILIIYDSFDASYDETLWINFGSSITYAFDNLRLDKISARKKMESPKKIDISNKINSIGLGVFTNKQFNFLQVTQDYKISDKWAVFAAFGFPNICGVGITGQSNYNDNGLISGASLGLDASGDSIISLTAAHQWRIGSSATFFSLGISRFMTKNDESEGHAWSTAPIISIDARF